MTVLKKHILTSIFILISCAFSAQSGSDIDILFQKARTSVLPSSSVIAGFELLRKAKEVDDEDKIKYALSVISDGYYGLATYSKCIEYANRVTSRNGSDKYFSKIYATRRKSLCYFKLKLSEKAISEHIAAISMADKITNRNTDEYHKIKGLLWRDKSVLYYFHSDDTILSYDKKSLAELLQVKKRSNGAANLSTPYNNIAYDFMLLKKYDSVFYYCKKAEYYAKKDNDLSHLAYTYSTLGEYYEETGRPHSAIVNYKKAFDIAKNKRELDFARENSDYLRTIYLKINDKAKSSEYDKIYFQLKDSIEIAHEKELNKVLNIIEDTQEEEFTQSNAKKYWIIGSLIILIAILSLYTFYQYRKNKKDYLKFTTIIEEIESRTISEVQEKTAEKTLVSNISDVKEHELMKKLNNFEKKEQYLSPEISLSSLSTTFNTNVNYLSKVIKKYRYNNFNGYINELRINYITKKLRTNPEYLNYKIAYLAAECGYSSYSSFVSIFKQQTGLTPSKFVEYLSKENHNISNH